MWRSDDWKKRHPNPCENCTRKEEDEYGMLCDISCGGYTHHLTFESGADAMLSALENEPLVDIAHVSGK